MMYCFFCSSGTHISLYCTKFTSNESRKKIAQLKDHCDSCLTSLNSSGTHLHGKCTNDRKCYICFSRNHHTVFCSNRFGVSSIFFPKIDSIFFQRFFEIFNAAEKFLLIYSLTEPQKVCAIKSVKVLYRDLWYNKFSDKKYTPTIFVAKKFRLNNIVPSYLFSFPEHPQHFLNALSAQTVIFKATNITLANSKITYQEFFKLFSSCTKTLICTKLQLSANVNFATILKKLPQLEILEISESNININYKWPQDLLQYTHGNNLKKVNITCNNLNINYDKLVTFMTTKSAKNIHIILYVDYAFNKNYAFHIFRLCFQQNSRENL